MNFLVTIYQTKAGGDFTWSTLGPIREVRYGQSIMKLEQAMVAALKGAIGSMPAREAARLCATRSVRLTRVQKAGGNPVGAADFLRGTPLPRGARLY